MKYRGIMLLIDALAAPIAAGEVALAERWQDNEEAVGLYRPGEPALAAFVFTYGQRPGRYAAELAFPALVGTVAAGVPVQQEELTLARLLDVLQAHFELAQRPLA